MNHNLFINFQRGKLFHTRGYDSLSSSARKKDILKRIEYIANPNTSEITDLEETTISIKIGKTGITMNKRLHYISSINLNVFSFITRFQNVQKLADWKEDVSKAMLEALICPSIYDTLSNKNITQEIFDELLHTKYNASCYNKYNSYLLRLNLHDFHTVDEYLFTIVNV